MNDITEDLAAKAMVAQFEQEILSAELIDIRKELVAPSTSAHELLETIVQKGDHWQAQLFSFCQGASCHFYKECFNKKCRSEQEARILIEYGRNIARINRISNELLDEGRICWN
ncbi:MAG: hypothetical protein AAGI23_08505 [Bacteroidota bacterium]